ncbi:hypothetical protein, partial [Thermogutta sp.]|uniref:hypothetical protein n=1 Tax=Thermogutta sp. TaxID=1962930 RepID=UPI00321F79A8
MLFDIEANRVGEISRILNQYAEKIADNPRRKRDLIEEAWQTVVEKLGLERTEAPKTEEPTLFGFDAKP